MTNWPIGDSNKLSEDSTVDINQFLPSDSSSASAYIDEDEEENEDLHIHRYDSNGFEIDSSLTVDYPPRDDDDESEIETYLPDLSSSKSSGSVLNAKVYSALYQVQFI